MAKIWTEDLYDKSVAEAFQPTKQEMEKGVVLREVESTVDLLRLLESAGRVVIERTTCREGIPGDSYKLSSYNDYD